MTDPATFALALPNETATAHLMADLALLVGPGDVVTLSGDLGAGKTTAARAMIRYLAGDETLEVPSPTFTLAQAYDLPPFPLVHADLYRVNDAAELEEIGLSPLPEATLALIEWPERAAGALPADRIDIAFSHRPALGSSARAAEITGYGSAAAQVVRLRELRQFLAEANYADARRQHMPGDASTRSYARLVRDDGSVILMNSPRRPDGPAIYHGKSYSTAVHLAEDVKPFVAIAGGLRQHGFSAPAIHHADLDNGFLITEDFGSAGFVAGDPPIPIAERYQAAADMLAALHRAALPETLPVAPHIAYVVPSFDTEALLVEAGLMLEWYLPDRGAEPDSHARAEFVAMWRDLLRKPAAAPRHLGAAGLPFSQSDLARRTVRHRESGRDRFPGCGAGSGQLRSGVAAAGCPDRCPRAARAGAADALHQGAARRRPDIRCRRLRRTLRHHVGAAKHPAARDLCPAQPA